MLKDLLYESQRIEEGECITNVHQEQGKKTIVVTLQNKDNKKFRNKYVVAEKSKLEPVSSESLTSKQYRKYLNQYLKSN